MPSELHAEGEPMTMRQIAREANLAYLKQHGVITPGGQADVIAVAVLQEVARNCSAQLLDQWFAEFSEVNSVPPDGSGAREKEIHDQGAGLIHQTIPDVDDTEPRLNRPKP
jgi:hypothetical protein